MRHASVYLLVVSAALVTLLFISVSSVTAQSQAQNGQIEGTILDQRKAVVPNASVSLTNIETGASRVSATDESGLYRFPLLPLGTYRINVEATNFKKLVREGVILTTGQTATVDLVLDAGEVKEIVTVFRDSSVADAGKTDLGRVMNANEVQNLPLLQRNPYNFGLLQANVTGRPARGFNFPNLNVNGYLRRVNYLLDGNSNTAYDRRSRFLIISETSVSEVQLVTNGFAAEFGDTPGMIMNIVTPSGTNDLHGAVSYRFRRPSFYSRPFLYPGSDLPDNKANIFTAAFGGSIIRDRWHYYFGYEYQYRDDKAGVARVSAITADTRDRLIAAGLSPSIFPPGIPTLDRGSNYLFRTDLQINENHRLSARVNYGKDTTDNLVGSRVGTLERSVDAKSRDYGLGIQLASYTSKLFNESRFSYGQSVLGYRRNEFSGSGPSILIPGVAQFGSPIQATSVAPPLKIVQFQDNVTRTFGTHIIKFGAGFIHHDYIEPSPIYSLYRFSTVTDYVAARAGVLPRGYDSYEQASGDLETNYKARYWNFFIQDDWKVTRRLKLNLGLRYDLYKVPAADRTSLFHLSQRFDLDKNDFAPRVGLVYSVNEGRYPTVVRIGAGIYYEAPLLAIYRDVIRFNGNSRFISLTFSPSDIGAPDFPNLVGALPAGATPPPQDIYTIASDYDTMYAIHSNIQFEQGITDNMAFSAGYVHSSGRHLNVYRNINAINPVRYLADGRPVFGNDRLDDRFGTIVIAESSGVANYDALSFQLKQRLSKGLQFSINYTLAKATNDAPDGDFEGIFLSDPTNRNVDRGYSSADQRHTFVTSLVLQPKFGPHNKIVDWVMNNNQLGVIATANTGERFNIYANLFDLNGDGIDTDRPVGIKRNAGKTPPQYNVDLRYSRFLRFNERYRLELFAEFQNVFNIKMIVGYPNTVVPTNRQTGQVIGQVPDFRARNQAVAQDSRQTQLGLKFIF